jgi:hypothetical protein
MNHTNQRPRLNLLAVGLGLLGMLPLQAYADDNKIEGTWINDVKIVSCASPQTVLAAFPSMTTYLRGGVLIEGGGPGGPPPAVWRSAGHGVWASTGRHTFQGSFRSHFFDSLGRLVRITEVNSNVTLTQGDDPNTAAVEPYYLAGWGTNKITNLDPASGAVLSIVPGCNYATSRPMLLD